MLRTLMLCSHSCTCTHRAANAMCGHYQAATNRCRTSLQLQFHQFRYRSLVPVVPPELSQCSTTRIMPHPETWFQPHGWVPAASAQWPQCRPSTLPRRLPLTTGGSRAAVIAGHYSAHLHPQEHVHCYTSTQHSSFRSTRSKPGSFPHRRYRRTSNKYYTSARTVPLKLEKDSQNPGTLSPAIS
jgi:hypothetical protein